MRLKAKTLVQAMETALQADAGAAQLVAAECVVDAETKDHQNWELMNEVSQKLTGDEAKALKEAYSEVGEQEDEHLFHSMGWSRELWDRVLAYTRCATSSRGGEGRQVRARCRSRSSGAEGDAVARTEVMRTCGQH